MIFKTQGNVHFPFRFTHRIADGGMCPNQLKSDFRDYSQRRSLLLEKNKSSLKEALLCAQTQKIGTMLADYTSLVLHRSGCAIIQLNSFQKVHSGGIVPCVVPLIVLL